MRAFAEQPFLAVWYAHLDVDDAIARFRSQLKKKRVKATQKLVAKAHTADSTKALSKLTTQVDGQRRIISDPPLIEPVEEVFSDEQASAIYELIREALGKYQRTLQIRPQAPAGAVHAGSGGPQGGRGGQRRRPAAGSR